MEVKNFVVAVMLSLSAGMAATAAWSPDQSARESIVFVGSFYHEHFTKEHQYRYQIDLWREGQRVFGLTSTLAGLIGDRVPSLVGRFEGTMNPDTGSLNLSNRFRGSLRGSLLTGAYESDPGTQVQFKRSSDHMATNPSQAPLTTYDAWRSWADDLIDQMEAKDPYLRQELAKCKGGDGLACLDVGNRLRDRKPEEANRYWKRACDLDNWAGCKFFGDQARYQSILHIRCSSDEKPSLERNFACTELGETAEKAGKIGEAIEWYRLGCNEFELPTTNCTRLKTLDR